MKKILIINWEKEFIPYEQALALKELGFDEPCLGYYSKDNPILKFGEGFELVTRRYRENVMNYPLINSRYKAGNNAPDGYYYLTTAPLYQQAFRWFREKYKLDSWVYKSRDYAYFYSILKDSRYLSPSIEFNSYEEAELECLKKLIQIVNNNE
jgi:hypothetical protein